MTALSGTADAGVGAGTEVPGTGGCVAQALKNIIKQMTNLRMDMPTV